MKATDEEQKAPTVPASCQRHALHDGAKHGADARRTVAGVESSVWTERMLSALVNGVVVAKHAFGMTVANGTR